MENISKKILIMPYSCVLHEKDQAKKEFETEKK